jgi:signal transduction histidine kinase
MSHFLITILVFQVSLISFILVVFRLKDILNARICFSLFGFFQFAYIFLLSSDYFSINNSLLISLLFSVLTTIILYFGYLKFKKNEIDRKKIIKKKLNKSKAETKKALKKLERSEFFLSKSGKLAKIGAWELKLDSQEVIWSDEVFAIHGLPVGKVPSFEECINFYVDGSAEALSKSIEESIAQKKKFDLVLRFNNNNNQKLWVNTIGYPLINEEGEIISLIGIFQDITVQKERQIKLDEQNEKLSKLNKILNEAQELAQLGSWEYILATGSFIWSKEMFNIFEIPIELGPPNYDEYKTLYKEDSFIKLEKAFENCIKKQTPYKLELDICTKKGTLKHIISRGKVIKDKNNNVVGIYGTVQDVTEQTKHQESLQKLTTEITLIEERQKKKIASNIHDHLSQSLVISNMKVKELRKIPELKSIDSDLEFIYEHIYSALVNSRNITSELSPPILYQLGIVEALYWLLECIETKHKIKSQINENVNEIVLDDVKSILLYRSIQELINNIIKYAQATLITIDINQNKLGLDIIITDNGIGFNTEKLNNFYTTSNNGGGFGLFTVQERIKNINGKFRITSKIKEGTTVNIFIPITNE